LQIKQQKSDDIVPEIAQAGSNFSTSVGELLFDFELVILDKNTLAMSFSVASEGC
jgi:hypothetical protein